jgi:membrane protease YdiL (CAAX protease family)
MRSHAKFPWLYLILAYGLAWLFWIPVALTGQDYQASALLLILVLLGVFGPGLAGILLTYLQDDREQRRDFWQRMLDVRRIRPLWLGVILLFWPGVQLLALVLNKLLGGTPPDSEFVAQMQAQPLSIPVVIGLYFLQAGLEELGWRGYLLERLLPGRGALKSALIVGIFHAFWHLPLFWIVGTNQIKMGIDLDFLVFVIGVCAYSIYTTWVYIGNGHSTLAATLFHCVGNLCLDIFVLAPGSRQYTLYLLLMLAGAVMLGAGWLRRRGVQKMLVNHASVLQRSNELDR